MVKRTKEEVEKWKKQLIEDAENKLLELTTSAKFKKYLTTLAHFHSYSLKNIELIAAQNENATLVMGYKGWLKLGRQVQKGAKAIYITAPMVAKLTEEEKIKYKTTEDYAIKGFTTKPVFDISDTEGKPLTLASDFIAKKYTTEQTEKFSEEQIKEVVKIIEKDYKIPITFKELDRKSLGGFYNGSDHSITINTMNTKTEQLRTVFHEFAHSQLHSIDALLKLDNLPSREYREAQAESVAYLTMTTLGIDTSSYSVGYISTWTKNIDLMRKALEDIKSVFDTTYEIAEKASKNINLELIENLDNKFASSLEIQKSLDDYSKNNPEILPKNNVLDRKL